MIRGLQIGCTCTECIEAHVLLEHITGTLVILNREKPEISGVQCSFQFSHHVLFVSLKTQRLRDEAVMDGDGWMMDETERESTKGPDRQNCSGAADKVMLPSTWGQIQFSSPRGSAANCVKWFLLCCQKNNNKKTTHFTSVGVIEPKWLKCTSSLHYVWFLLSHKFTNKLLKEFVNETWMFTVSINLTVFVCVCATPCCVTHAVDRTRTQPHSGSPQRLLVLWSRQHLLCFNALSLILAPSQCLWIWVFLLNMISTCVKKHTHTHWSRNPISDLHI